MIPRSAAEGQEVNSRNADEVFPEHGGWKSTASLKTAYQQADPETILKVVLEGHELREAR